MRYSLERFSTRMAMSLIGCFFVSVMIHWVRRSALGSQGASPLHFSSRGASPLAPPIVRDAFAVGYSRGRFVCAVSILFAGRFAPAPPIVRDAFAAGSLDASFVLFLF